MNMQSHYLYSLLIHYPMESSAPIVAKFFEREERKVNEWRVMQLVAGGNIQSKSCIFYTEQRASTLVPRPHPAFHRLYYRNAGRAWYLLSREHDILSKWQNFSEWAVCVSHVVQPATHSTLGIYESPSTCPLSHTCTNTLARIISFRKCRPTCKTLSIPKILVYRVCVCAYLNWSWPGHHTSSGGHKSDDCFFVPWPSPSTISYHPFSLSTLSECAAVQEVTSPPPLLPQPPVVQEVASSPPPFLPQSPSGNMSWLGTSYLDSLL